jgi:glycosyltransferase involved in cell wall biosynthesis
MVRAGYAAKVVVAVDCRSLTEAPPINRIPIRDLGRGPELRTLGEAMSSDRTGLENSDLSRLIDPEIKGDAFYDVITHLAATEALQTVLEIGSSSGGGSTEALVAGISRNRGSPKLFCIEVSEPRFRKLQEAYKDCPFVHCYNLSTVGINQFPKPDEVIAFYKEVPSGLRQFSLSTVLNWLRQDIEYIRESRVETGAIAKIKADHGITTFDMVLIDGSEFTGYVEYSLILGARFILLDDTNTFKCYKVRQSLLSDPMYDLIADDQGLRNGYSVFKRRTVARQIGGVLPIHFFTIVLNGEPFVRYHERVFQRLLVAWHWHVIEGVASLKHDTAWSVAAGGHVAPSGHFRGRSNDGTTEYLDEVKRRFPDNVSIYRKPLDEFWDGKKEMVNAALINIDGPCLLWQIDSDELWTAEQIHSIHDLFMRHPSRTAAYYWCWYYVGPDKIISTRYNYAQNPRQDWLRTWRYEPGAIWLAHEPPTLIAPTNEGANGKLDSVDIAKVNPFTQDETEQVGAVFQHFAYATDDQVTFKEQYYGYKGATAQWRALQAQTGSGKLRDFFGWVSDDTIYDDVSQYPVRPLAQVNPADGCWTFDRLNPTPSVCRPTRRPRILIDGIFWQYLSGGIGRLWENLLREWVISGFADNVILLDRVGTAPRVPSIHYWTIAKNEYDKVGRDSIYLQDICHRFDADLFVSTYYSTPTDTPSFFMGYDMIPEVLGLPLEDGAWQEKRRAILHASAHGMISQNSAADLEATYPSVRRGSTYVIHGGIDPRFYRPLEEEIDAFCQNYGVARQTYVIMVGERLGFGGYKNASLAFRALANMPEDSPLSLICVGGAQDIEPCLRELAPMLDVRRLALGDDDLRAAYAGAHTLVYPSRYEGFGLPPLESMACGTPAIVCRNSSLPEVVGEAALYVDESDPTDMSEAIVKLHNPVLRADVVARGLKQAANFTFDNMARTLAIALIETHDRLHAGVFPSPSVAWSEMRRWQQDAQALAAASQSEIDRARQQLAASQLEMNHVRTERDRVLQTSAAMRNSPFWKAREHTVRALRSLGLRRRM